jgi:hypothetical protein
VLNIGAAMNLAGDPSYLKELAASVLRLPRIAATEDGT